MEKKTFFDWQAFAGNCEDFVNNTHKVGILLVAYGSSSVQSSSALRAFQKRMENYYKVPIRLAFTSETMRERLAHAMTKSDSVLKALQKMYFERFTHVAVQSLHLINGVEYYDVLGDIALAREKTSLNITAGLPLLSCEEDVPHVSKALLSLLPLGFGENDRVVWMGHGSNHESDHWYDKLAKEVHTLDQRLYVGCMDGEFVLDKIFARWQASCDLGRCPNCVWLMPLLTVVGKHALHDMAGDQEDSWKSQLTQAGYFCKPHLLGLAEGHLMQNIWMQRLETAFLAFISR